TAMASAGMACWPVPVPAIVKLVVDPAAGFAPVRVSTTRKGLYALPDPSAASTRTALSRFQRLDTGLLLASNREAQIELSLPRTSSCSNVYVPVLVTWNEGAKLGPTPPTSRRPTIPSRPEPTAPPTTGKP